MSKNAHQFDGWICGPCATLKTPIEMLCSGLEYLSVVSGWKDLIKDKPTETGNSFIRLFLDGGETDEGFASAVGMPISSSTSVVLRAGDVNRLRSELQGVDL